MKAIQSVFRFLRDLLVPEPVVLESYFDPDTHSERLRPKQDRPSR